MRWFLMLVVGLLFVPAWAADAPGVDFRYAYYPSHNVIRFLVPQAPAAVTGWQVALRAEGQEKALAEQAGYFPYPAAGCSMKTPDLPEGKYILTLTLKGEGEPVVVQRTIERRHFPWEKNTLGRDDVIVPPYTPLVADAKKGTVACILRSHRMNGAGLWEQVTSEEKPLLASPMRLETEIGGTVQTAKGKQPQFTTVKPTTVAGKTAWQAGALKGSTEFTFDYDGFMQVTLRLSPTKEEVSRLRLVIPMPQEEAWLMHPVTIGLRQHYAGRIPEGEGKVWDSAKTPRGALAGTFIPYIWIGGPERGICWCADNDRDWITDPKVPALEITREKGVVSLVVNLISKPATITRERKIEFCLQATPSKPMATQPYSFRRWWAHGTDKKFDDVNFNIWGATMYWGARWPVMEFYPANQDFRFFEQLSKGRRTGKIDPGFLEEWFKGFPNLSTEEYNSLKAHWNAGLTWAAITPANTPETKKFRYVLPYTSPRSASWANDAFRTTYVDEWSLFDVADPRWTQAIKGTRALREAGKGIWYEIEPVDSYVDFVLYYHKKMYEAFADGIYWDNIFLQANYIPEEAGGPGYIDDDGNLKPGVNLMAFRELTKRNAVMMHAMGRFPLTWLHMTNVNIVPILSFGTINYDWEWRDQGAFAVKDLQDRLGCDKDTDLILAMSTGLQSGNISVACDRFNPPKDSGVTRDWLLRTVMAVCLPHEIKVHQGNNETTRAANLMSDFGYGQPDCKVYRYWDTPQAITTQGAPVKTLLLQRGARAMIIAGSYGDGGDCTLTLDLKALGLQDTVKATNAETKEPLRAETPGTFVLPIRKHDVALIVVE